MRLNASAFPVGADDEVEDEGKDEEEEEEEVTPFPAKNDWKSLSPGFLFSRLRKECIAAVVAQ